MGDFNLYKKDKEIVDIFEKHQFKESDILRGLNTNTAISQETFDRMFFSQTEFFKTPSAADGDKGGVLDIFEIIYILNNFKSYEKEMKAHKENPADLVDEAKLQKYFKNNWRKTQLSDHKPIWVEINIDSSDEFLMEKKTELTN